MPSFHDFARGLRQLGIERDSPVIAHASLSAFGQMTGGAETLVGALLASFNAVIMPAFTYLTMLTPESGPPGNGLIYGAGKDTNRMAEFYTPDLPADRTIGAVSEALRRHPKAVRSMHPILSFTGVNAASILQAQTLSQPLEPIHALADAGGWVLLLGVDHTSNTSIHYAERLAGRKQFVRWALTPDGIVACPGWPGCSDGFQALAPRLEPVRRSVQVSSSLIQAFPLTALVEAVTQTIAEDPFALLCHRPDCGRCNAVRETPFTV
ncbi:MAG TPA: AAC(3) family N-acetyltransferase [Anaerolineales bacterium]|nr:AAC(3) family N-acetyltransferase [Anaerolineales bacterium]